MGQGSPGLFIAKPGLIVPGISRLGPPAPDDRLHTLLTFNPPTRTQNTHKKNELKLSHYFLDMFPDLSIQPKAE